MLLVSKHWSKINAIQIKQNEALKGTKFFHLELTMTQNESIYSSIPQKLAKKRISISKYRTNICMVSSIQTQMVCNFSLTKVYKFIFCVFIAEEEKLQMSIIKACIHVHNPTEVKRYKRMNCGFFCIVKYEMESIFINYFDIIYLLYKSANFTVKWTETYNR